MFFLSHCRRRVRDPGEAEVGVGWQFTGRVGEGGSSSSRNAINRWVLVTLTHYNNERSHIFVPLLVRAEIIIYYFNFQSSHSLTSELRDSSNPSATRQVIFPSYSGFWAVMPACTRSLSLSTSVDSLSRSFKVSLTRSLVC